MIEETKEVSDVVSRWLSDSWTLVTWGIEETCASWAWVSGVPPPWPPKKPFGETEMVLPVEARTESIFLVTASRAMSIEIARAMATARIRMTPTERMAFRKVFFTPRRSAFTDPCSPSYAVGGP